MARTAWTVALVATGVCTAGPLGAQDWARTDVGWCDRDWGGSESDRHCHVLTAELADPGGLSIDGGTNGGVSVQGWNGDGVEVRAKVWANARTVARAEELAAAVRVEYEGRELSAEGPATDRRESWGVNWELMVPRATDLDLETHNGGVAVTEVTGRIRFNALNGGVQLRGTGGDVEGKTTNGGVHLQLEGDTWSGAGLDVETTNGGVTVQVPSDYSAALETSTVNGRIDIDFPVTVQGRIGRSLDVVLGDGGATIRAVTTNGGVRIARAGTARR